MKTKLAGMGGATQTYVDDVFSTYLYTGNGSTQTITNGIDLAGKGGLVWIKNRNNGDGSVTPNDHALLSTVTGVEKVLSSNTSGQLNTHPLSLTSFNSDGFSLGSSGSFAINSAGKQNASWTFRKAAKFFDVVTWTGNGVAGRQIAHSLGIAPGMMIVKVIDQTSNWSVYHRSMNGNGNGYMFLNTTAAAYSSGNLLWGNGTDFIAPTATNFTIGSDSFVNYSGYTYVAYLFAHDTAADGIIQCGSYTGTGATGLSVNLGWEPQYVLIKNTSATSHWQIFDIMRGMPVSSGASWLYANGSFAEYVESAISIFPTASGFQINRVDTAGLGDSNINISGNSYIYMAIRRPNKPPTSGTQVYNAIARTGTGAAATVTGVGFAPDLAMINIRDTGTRGWVDKLRGAKRPLLPAYTDAERTSLASKDVGSFDMDGISFSGGSDQFSSNSTLAYINHFFRRALGFFDVVCYTGTGSATTQAHNLGVVPELIIQKNRTAADAWETTCANFSNPNQQVVRLNTNGAILNVGVDYIYNRTATSVSFNAALANSGSNYVAYLFATLAGISKVGSYTGNGGTQNIDCGFAAGARFVLIKRTDSTGDWFVWDTARGIVAANDPHLSLNTAAAEVTTDDSIDPLNAGFTVNQVAATNINVSSATYIYLAIA